MSDETNAHWHYRRWTRQPWVWGLAAGYVLLTLQIIWSIL